MKNELKILFEMKKYFEEMKISCETMLAHIHKRIIKINKGGINKK